ncbi:MAG: ATP-binding protein [Ktedonobacteraceae bacterium]
MSNPHRSPGAHESPLAVPVQITSTSLHQFFDISPDALVVVNQAGMIVMVNKQAEILLGYSHEESVGQQLEILLPQRFRQAHIDHRKHYFAAPITRQMGAGLQLSGRRSDGTEFPVDISLRPLLLDGVPHAVGAIRDVTEQKMLEEQLQGKNEELEEQYRRVQEANRLKDEFLANMSHELRTPLNAIIGFTEMMYDGEVEDDPETQHEYLGDVLSSSRHLLQLINDVLDLAKVQAGKMTFYPEKVNLEQVVGEVRDILRLLIHDKHLRFETEIDKTLRWAVIDPSKLKQVLYNYLSNAFKFTPDEGQVTVRIKREGEGAILIEVEDTGIGIPPEDIGRLFVEFQQLDAGMAKKHRGTGLGLALTRSIVEAQGGRVGVRSVPGQGSTFFAILPQVNTTIKETAEQQSEVPWKDPLVPPQEDPSTVLVIEDDSEDRARLVSFLIGAGYAIETAATAAEALKRCQERTFDVITLDLLLPDASGWDVQQKIRAGGPNRDAPIIVITQMKKKDATMGFPIQDILNKPVQMEDLLASLEQARPEKAITDRDEQRSRHTYPS